MTLLKKMRTNVLIISLLFITLSAFTLQNSFNINAPSMKIESKIGAFKPGDVVYYTINICSSDFLEYFEVSPDIIGSNNDSKVNFNFNQDTKVATINYFYVIPENIKDIEKINISFIIRDRNKERVIEKEIFIN